MDKTLKSYLGYLLRYAIVFIGFGIIAAFIESMVLLEVKHAGNVVENGLVEITQVSVLGVAFALYMRLSVVKKIEPHATFACAMFIACMFVRELDGILDKLLFHGSWKIFVAIIVAFTVSRILGDLRNALDQIIRFTRTPGFVLLSSAVIIAVVIAQIIGCKHLWSGFFPENPTEEEAHIIYSCFPHVEHPYRVFKNIVEESFELCSYIIILFSSFASLNLLKSPLEGQSDTGSTNG